MADIFFLRVDLMRGGVYLGLENRRAMDRKKDECASLQFLPVLLIATPSATLYEIT